MKPFIYTKTGSIYQVIELLTKYGETARLWAGGTDLFMLIKQGIRAPEHILDLKSIQGLNYIRWENEILKIGATTLVADLENSPAIGELFPGLARAAHLVASVQIRNMGTVGGNLCQNAQCLYYRNACFNCYRKGGNQCFAFDGENKYGAIFVAQESEKCWAGHPSDLAAMLMALQAKVKLVGPAGDRIISLDEFYTELGTILSPSEIMVEIQVPKPPQNQNSEYLKLRISKGGAGFPIASAAVALTINNEICSQVNIVLGGVAPYPWRAGMAEQALLGQAINEENVQTAVGIEMQRAKPLKKNAYKESMIKALMERAILSAGLVSKP